MRSENNADDKKQLRPGVVGSSEWGNEKSFSSSLLPSEEIEIKFTFNNLLLVLYKNYSNLNESDLIVILHLGMYIAI